MQAHKRDVEGVLTHAEKEVAMEAESGERWPQAKGSGKPPAAGRDKEQIHSWNPWRDRSPERLRFQFSEIDLRQLASRAVIEQISAVLHHLCCESQHRKQLNAVTCV